MKLKLMFAAFAVATVCGCATGEDLSGAKAVIRGEDAVVRVNVKECGSIVIANNQAARELRDHLAMITGCDVPVVTNLTGREKFVLNVGFTPPGVDPKVLKPEEGRWQFGATNAFFYGQGGNGPRIAVVTFLEDELGVRWPWGTNVSYRARNPIAVRHATGAWYPEIRMRGIRGGSGIWRSRLRYGGHDKPLYGHAFTDYIKRGFLKTHPEYFAMRKDGKRLPPNAGNVDNPDDIAQLLANSQARFSICCTSTSLVQQIIADWKRGGVREYVNICENDATGGNVCHCPACEALDCPPPENERLKFWPNWYADRYVYLGNAVLKEARKIRPDAKACFYAYNATEQAPRKTKVSDGLVVGLVPTYFTIDKIKKYLDDWAKAGLKDFFWRPNRHGYYSFPVLPGGCDKHFFRIFQLVQARNPIGYDYDGGWRGSVLEYFKDYLIYKGMQDPSKSFEYWEDHYFSAFGPAKEDVKGYFRFWREEVWEKRLEPNILTIPKHPWGGADFYFCKSLLLELGKWYKEEDFTAAEKFLVDAAARRGLSDGDRGRIGELQLAHRHGLLFFRAVANKCEANTKALYEFRKAHRDQFELIYWGENYFGPGDLTGCREYMFANHPEDLFLNVYRWEFKRLKRLNDAGVKLKPHEVERLAYLKGIDVKTLPKR